MRFYVAFIVPYLLVDLKQQCLLMVFFLFIFISSLHRLFKMLSGLIHHQLLLQCLLLFHQEHLHVANIQKDILKITTKNDKFRIFGYTIKKIKLTVPLIETSNEPILGTTS